MKTTRYQYIVQSIVISENERTVTVATPRGENPFRMARIPLPDGVFVNPGDAVVFTVEWPE